jgi:copper chaperone NosL
VMVRSLTGRAGVALVLASLLAACAKGPDALHWGVEECAYCQMLIGDARYAGQVVDRRGRTYKFDALECMAAFVAGGELAAADIHSAWIANGPDAWTPVEEATFLHSEQVRSPMGGGYVAFPAVDEALRLQSELGGELLSWQELLTRVERSGHAHESHGSGGAAR